jgi:hypothetical protein
MSNKSKVISQCITTDNVEDKLQAILSVDHAAKGKRYLEEGQQLIEKSEVSNAKEAFFHAAVEFEKAQDFKQIPALWEAIGKLSELKGDYIPPVTEEWPLDYHIMETDEWHKRKEKEHKLAWVYQWAAENRESVKDPQLAYPLFFKSAEHAEQTEQSKDDPDWPAKLYLNAALNLIRTYRSIEHVPDVHRIDEEYLFSWDNIPGNDNGRLIDFLKQNYGIDWVETAEIKKIDDGKTIILSTKTIILSIKKNSLYLKLNDKYTNVSLEIDDGRTGKFIAKMENSKLNIYNEGISDKEKIKSGIEKMKTHYERFEDKGKAYNFLAISYRLLKSDLIEAGNLAEAEQFKREERSELTRYYYHKRDYFRAVTEWLSGSGFNFFVIGLVLMILFVFPYIYYQWNLVASVQGKITYLDTMLYSIELALGIGNDEFYAIGYGRILNIIGASLSWLGLGVFIWWLTRRLEMR